MNDRGHGNQPRRELGTAMTCGEAYRVDRSGLAEIAACGSFASASATLPGVST